MMNRTQLSAFTAVAEAGGFTKGARRLMVSQPAVSLHVAELERTLRAKLFDRLPRGVRLTAAGHMLLGFAKRIESLEGEAESAIADLLGLRRGKLIIGASLTIGSYFLPIALGEFRRRHPQIDLEMEIANTQQIESLVRENRVDLAFTEGLAPKDASSALTIYDDRLVPIAPPNHPLLKHKRITAALVCREELILREVGSGTRDVIEAEFARRRLKIRPLMSLGSTEAIKRAVEAGVGLAVVSELAVENEVRAGTLVVLAVAALTIDRPFRVLRPLGKSDSPAAAAFLEVVRERAIKTTKPTKRTTLSLPRRLSNLST
jgi:DNA-binding transcriptional LysR family regulator